MGGGLDRTSGNGRAKLEKENSIGAVYTFEMKCHI